MRWPGARAVAIAVGVALVLADLIVLPPGAAAAGTPSGPPELHATASAGRVESPPRPVDPQPPTEGWSTYSHWHLDDTGRRVADLFTEPTFRRSGGKWLPVDPTARPTSDDRHPVRADGALVPVAFGARASEIVSFDVGGGAVVLSADGLDVGPPSLGRQAVTYRGVAADTDLRYRVSPAGVKEEIVLGSPASPTSFRFHLADADNRLGGLARQADGSWRSAKEIAPGAALAVPAPFAYEQPASDSTPVPVDAGSAAMTVDKAGDGYDITVAVDPEWIAGKRFPIVLDPTVSFPNANGAVLDGYSRSDSGLAQDARLYAGTASSHADRSFLRFDLSSIPWNSAVSYASLTLDDTACLDAGIPCPNLGYSIEAHRMTAAWGAGTPWATLAGATDGVVLASVAGNPSQYNVYQTWDLTAQVQRWVKGTDANYGVALRAANESLGLSGPAWESSRSGNTSARPVLTVTFAANSTHGLPPAPPATTGAFVYSATADNPVLPAAPRRTDIAEADGSQSVFWLSSGSNNTIEYLRSQPPYTAASRAYLIPTSFDTTHLDITNSDRTMWKVSAGSLGPSIDKFALSGSTWSQVSSASINKPLAATWALQRAAQSGWLWIAYTASDALLNTHLFVNYSTDGGATFNNELDTGTVPSAVTSAHFVVLGSSGVVGLAYQAGPSLLWKTSSSWTAAPVTVAAVDGSSATATSWQASALDNGQVVLAYSTAALGVRAQALSGSAWSAAVTLDSEFCKLSTATDGAGAWVAYTKNSTATTVVRRYDGSAWGAPSSLAGLSGAPSMPERVDAHSVPVWAVNGLELRLDRYDDAGPAVSMAAPGDASSLSGTVRVAASASDGGSSKNVARVDFYADRGDGFVGFLGSSTSTDASGQFSYSWNTAESPGAWNPYGSGRLWPAGAYRLYAVAWDRKGHSSESGRIDASLVVNEYGLHPYRPAQSFDLGGGASASVNLYNGNLIIDQADVAEPTVIGPLSLGRTYNSQDTADHKAGTGWTASAELDLGLVFRQLIDHSGDPDYPSGTVELVTADGGGDFFFGDGKAGYFGLLSGASRLDRNGDGTWTLKLVDGTRWTFRADGYPSAVTVPAGDASGQSYTYGYNTSGQLASIGEPTGRAVTLDYDGNGRILHVHDFDATRTWTYGYTGTTLTSVTDPAGRVTQFAYDASSPPRINQITDPRGLVTYVDYDASNRVLRVRQRHNGADLTTSFDYTSALNPKVTSYRGNLAGCDAACKAFYTVTYGMDANGRVVRITKPLPGGGSATKTIGWDETAGLAGPARPRNLKTSESDFLGHTTRSVYDELGDVVSTTDPVGSTETHRYDENDNTTSYDGLFAEYFPNQTFTPSPGYPLRRIEYPGFVYTACSTPGPPPRGCSPDAAIPVDHWSARWSGWVDVPATGTWSVSTVSDDGVRLWVDGRLVIDNWTDHGPTTNTSPALTLTAGLHDFALQYYENTSAAQLSVSWSGPGTVGYRLGLGLETSRSEPNGHTHTLSYDGPLTRHLVSEREPSNDYGGVIETDYSYNDPATGAPDPYGRLRKKNPPNGVAAGDASSYATVYSYYAAGATATDPCTGASANQGGLVSTVTIGTSGAVAAVSQVYDSRGNEVALTNGKGTTCQGYDAANRLVTIKAPDRAAATTYSYDADSNRTQVADPVAGTSTYAYDDLNRLLTAQDVFGGTTATYSYDTFTPSTQAVTRTDGAATKTDTLDQLGRVTATSFKPTWQAAADQYAFTYDANDQIATRAYPDTSTVETRAYDNAGRVTSLKTGYWPDFDYSDASFAESYDANSRRTSEAGVNGRSIYQYDEAGRLVRAHDGAGYDRSYTYDNNSNRTGAYLQGGYHYDGDTGPDPAMSAAVTPVNFTDTDNGSTQVSLPFAFPFYGGTLTSLWVSVNGYASTAQNGSANPSIPTTKGIFPMARDFKMNAGATVVTSVDDPLNPTIFAVSWNVNNKSDDQFALPWIKFTMYLYRDGRVRFGYGFSGFGAYGSVGASTGNGFDFVNVGPAETRGTAFVLPYSMTENLGHEPAITLTPHSGSTSLTTYDALDRATPDATHTYDTAGNATRVGANTYGYDGRSLLTTATAGAGTTTFAYDGESREVTETAGATTTRLRYDAPGDTGAAYETDGADNVQRVYLAGPGGQLAEYTPTKTMWDLVDPHGSVVVRRDASNSDAIQSNYDAFGNWEGTLGGGQQPKTGYLGADEKRTDPGSGVMVMGVRAYDPAQGRFLQRDPIDGGSCSAYDYVCGDPVNSFDLAGTCRVGPKIWGIGCAVDRAIKSSVLKAAPLIAGWACKTLGLGGGACAAISGAFIGIITYWINQWYDNEAFKWDAALKAAAIGAGKSLAAYGFASVGGWLQRWWSQFGDVKMSDYSSVLKLLKKMTGH